MREVLGLDSCTACLFGSQSPVRLCDQRAANQKRLDVAARRNSYLSLRSRRDQVDERVTDRVDSDVGQFTLRARLWPPRVAERTTCMQGHRLTLAPEMSQSHGAIATVGADAGLPFSAIEGQRMIKLHCLYVPYRP
jgi:hypothetical protein